METIKVEVFKEIYNNDKGFYIYIGQLVDSFEEISIKTNGFELCSGETTLVGNMGTYQGQKSFQCKYEEFDHNSKQAQKNLLMSIDGIKEAKAQLIIDNCENIEIFKNEDAPKIKGIGPGTILLIKEGLKKLDSMKIFKEINMLLGSSCTPNNIKKITESIEMVHDGLNEFKSNPYSFLIDHVGFGFKKTDKIALSMGIKINDKNRQLYLVEYIVKFYTQSGNCYIQKDRLIELLDHWNVTGDIDEIINDNKRLIIEDDCVYTSSMHASESNIPFYIKLISEKRASIENLDTYEVKKMINDFEKLNKIKFDEYQLQAIETAINNNVSIITGGAGCGKTTLLKCILYILREVNYNLFLTAPTGKAARRMSQSTEKDATTIHRFLNEAGDKYTRKNCVMIIDEVSMVDCELMAELLNTMENECSLDFTKLILVGDAGQLPSVQAGNILNDLIESDVIKTIKLTKTFRQAKDSNILDIANKVRHNQDFDYVKKQDFYVKELTKPSEYKESIIYFYDYLKSKYDDIDDFYSDVQFVTPTKKNDIGVNAINEMLKTHTNPKKEKADWFPFDKHDKIMCIKNDRENEIFNGEFGRITDIDKSTFTVFYKDLDKSVTYIKDSENVGNFQLSYCATVHKLQGSEFKYIVLILAQDSIICDSRLLYTAITRGKQTVIMLTNKSVTKSIVARNNLLKRNTKLKERMINQFQN